MQIATCARNFAQGNVGILGDTLILFNTYQSERKSSDLHKYRETQRNYEKKKYAKEEKILGHFSEQGFSRQSG